MVAVGVCIETVFTDCPYTERVRRVAKLGFSGISFWRYDQYCDGTRSRDQVKDIDGLGKVLAETGLEVMTFLVNSPDGTRSDSLVNPENREKYLATLRQAVAIAGELNCKKLTTCSGNRVARLSDQKQRKNMVGTLGEALEIVANANITLMLEPLNSVVRIHHKGHPGVFLDTFQEAANIVREIDHENIRLLFDIYHMQIMHGNILATIEGNMDIIAHLEAAGVPGRHELWRGELDYRMIMRALEDMGYDGYLGLEYIPSTESRKSLKTIQEYLAR